MSRMNLHMKRSTIITSTGMNISMSMSMERNPTQAINMRMNPTNIMSTDTNAATMNIITMMNRGMSTIIMSMDTNIITMASMPMDGITRRSVS